MAQKRNRRRILAEQTEHASLARSASVIEANGTVEPIPQRQPHVLLCMWILLSCVSCKQQADAPFTLVVLPDTQYYSSSHPEIFTAQTEWIKDRVDALSIVFVLHEGDIVNGVNGDVQWERANASISVLDGIVPYTLAVGNHDIDEKGDGFRDIEKTQRDSTKYNQIFPYSRYESKRWYGGHMGSDNDNHYVFFRAAGVDFMVVTLEVWPTKAILDWANQVVADHKDKKVIILTHDYLDHDDTLSGRNQYIWDQFVDLHGNIFLVLNGHVAWGDGVGRLTSTGTHGNRVHQVVANYQDPLGHGNGGNGWLRIMTFVPATRRIEVSTYSPWLDGLGKVAELTDDQNRFHLETPLLYDGQTMGEGKR